MPNRTKLVTWRDSYAVTWTGNVTSEPNSGNITNNPRQYATGNQTLIESSGHDLSDLGKVATGGRFNVVKRELYEKNVDAHDNRTLSQSPQYDSNGYASNFRGTYFAKLPVITNSSFSPYVDTPDAEMNALGTTAIARVLPTNPLVGLTTTLGEIRREGIPSVMGAQSLRARALRAREAGSEYLNVEFGWRPLVSEVLALADAIINSDEVMRQYERDSGKWIRREYTWDPSITKTETVETGKYPEPVFQLAYWNSSGTLTTTTTTKVERWFSGAFTYHLAPQGSLKRKEQLAAKRFGLRITPEVLWNLAPWTWAADWVSNMGDVIHNVSAFANDGLAMPYGYMMKRKTISIEYDLKGARMKYLNKPADCNQRLVTIVKKRTVATPFGFGLDPINFTNRQWAILVALGLSRGPGS